MSMPERRGTQALEAWARRATSGYEGVTITNMSTAWRDGLAFCALIHRFRPDLIEFSSLKSENILENNSLAFRIAEQQLGIPALLDAEDMVAHPVPDRLSILTYVSQYYRTFSALGLLAERKAKGKEGKAVGGDGGDSKTPRPQTPRPQTLPAAPKITETKTDKVLGRGGRGRREVCVACQQPVFLAERLLVGAPGQLMHRTCFRCARCSTQLTLAGYYQTERGQYCCETCPDEERHHPIALPSPSPPCQTDTDSESSSDESESNEEEGQSEAPRLPDTPAPTPSPTPPRPRTVFLTQTLTSLPEQPISQPENRTDRPSHFTSVSSVLFGAADKASRTREHSPDPAPLPRTKKSLKTEPPEVLDTGQTRSDTYSPPRIRTIPKDAYNRPKSSPVKTASSIVARRLQMFQELSGKDKQVDVRQQIASPDTTQERSLPAGLEQDSDHLKQREVLLDINTKEEEGKTTDIPSITVTSETTKEDDYDSSTTTTTTTTLPSTTTTTTTQPNPTTAENPFDEEEEEESALSPHETQCKETSLSESKDQVVSEPVGHREEGEPGNSHREESELGNSHREESGPGNSYREESDTQNTHTEIRKSEKSHIEERVIDKTQLDKVVNASQIDTYSKESHKDKVVRSEVECKSSEENQVMISTEPQQPTTTTTTTTTTTSQLLYPDDLNPFGSEDEEEEEEVTHTPALPHPNLKEPQVGDSHKNQMTAIAEPVVAAVEPAQDSPSRRLIKANLNPFESDEEKEEEDIPGKKEEKKTLNPFWSDDEEEEEEEAVRRRKDTISKSSKVKPPRPPPPTLLRNRSPSTISTISTASTSPRKKVIAPPPPSSPHLSLSSSPGGSVALRKKVRRAPAPPQLAPQTGRASPSDQDTLSLDTVSSGDREDPDEVLSWKIQKDLKNHSNKINGTPQAPPKPSRTPQIPDNDSETTITRHCSFSKSEAGEWKRKKGPAPLRPVPQKRALKKLPMKVIQQELQDIEIKQTELERQGVLLETSIRKRTETSAPSSPQEEAPPSSLPVSSPNSIEVEDMILQLFELVNEKNELFRRQTELMYLKREKRLEEEHVELEYQIRCLMLKAPSERSTEDATQEEELINRLVKVVEQRDEIINCLELDRLREAQEDESIATHMMQYQEKHIDGLENGNSHPEPPKKKKTLKLPKKKKKKEKKGASGDADKDVDETETPTDTKKKKKKKKWLF